MSFGLKERRFDMSIYIIFTASLASIEILTLLIYKFVYTKLSISQSLEQVLELELPQSSITSSSSCLHCFQQSGKFLINFIVLLLVLFRHEIKLPLCYIKPMRVMFMILRGWVFLPLHERCCWRHNISERRIGKLNLRNFLNLEILDQVHARHLSSSQQRLNLNASRH